MTHGLVSPNRDIFERAEFLSEIQSGSRDHISDQSGLSLTKPSTCAQSDRGILVILSVSIRAQRACDITSTYVAMVEDLTQGGRKPEHFIPARVSLPGMKRHGRGPSASSVDHSSLPSFGHHRGHRARGAQFTPPELLPSLGYLSTFQWQRSYNSCRQIRQLL